MAKQVLSDWMSGVQPRKIEHLYVVARELGVSMETLCFAASDGEILSKSYLNQSQSSGLAGATPNISSPERGVFSPDEIKGRFEIHLRRITDE